MTRTTNFRTLLLNAGVGTLLVASAALSSSSAAFADDLQKIHARLEALERENAAMRKENEALRESRRLREQNAGLKPTAHASRVTPSMQTMVVAEASMADRPVYKAPPHLEMPRRFQFWVEGGAIWSGGDEIRDTGTLNSFDGTPLGGATPYNFNLTPKVGFEVATGFDYRLASSPWHVSGQFRYAQGGKASGSAAGGGLINPILLGGDDNITGGSTAQSRDRQYQERRWLADLAVGRDIGGLGGDAIQIKAGLRVAEFTTRTSGNGSSNFSLTLAEPNDFGVLPAPVTAFGFLNQASVDARVNFLGAGPLVGIEGSIPFASRWSFDYKGNAAILFGTAQSLFTSVSTVTTDPPISTFGGTTASTNTAKNFNSIMSADMQVGVSYSFTQNVKLGASYRLDALINVQDENIALPDRYIHGPRVGLTTAF